MMQISMNVQLELIPVSRTATTQLGITRAAAVLATPSTLINIHVMVCCFGMSVPPIADGIIL